MIDFEDGFACGDVDSSLISNSFERLSVVNFVNDLHPFILIDFFIFVSSVFSIAIATHYLTAVIT